MQEDVYDFQIFKHTILGDIKALIKNGELWFIGADIAKMLGYEFGRHAVYEYVDDEDKMEYPKDLPEYIKDGLGCSVWETFINEFGVVSLVLNCYSDSGRAFKNLLRQVIHGRYLSALKDAYEII